MTCSYSSTSLRLGAGTRIECHTYPGDREIGPILTITAGDIHLALLSMGRGAATAEDVDIAHRLAEAVAVYVADIERLHACNENARSSGADRSGRSVA